MVLLANRLILETVLKLCLVLAKDKGKGKGEGMLGGSETEGKLGV